MPMNTTYKGPDAFPDVIPVFPLPGALLLPRGQMPLNIFEPRYLAMIDDALRSGHRLIGMIQPDPAHPGAGSEQAASVPGRLRRPDDAIRRKRRRPLSDPAHRRRALSHRGRACRHHAVPAVPGDLSALRRRLHRAQGRGRGRPQGAAARADRRSSRPTISRPIGRASRTRPTRRWSMRWR